MSESIYLSIVVPHYGDASPTRALVARLVPQLDEVRGEIIVVDDCSPLPLDHLLGAEVVRRHTNGGFGAAVNSGVAVARGELVMILNSDLIVADGFLNAFMTAAEPWLPAVVAPQVVTYGHEGATTFRFPSPWTVFAQRFAVLAHRRSRGWVSDLIGEDRPRNVDDDHAVDWVSGAAMLIPTDVLRGVGGFDERFHMYLEEVDLQRRLQAHGVPAVYVGKVKVEHLGFGSSDPARRELWQLESWLKYAEKWGWRRRLRLALEAASLANLATDGLRRALGRDVRPLADWRRHRNLTRSVWTAHARRQA